MFDSENGHIAKMKKNEHFISELNKASEDGEIKVFIEILEQVQYEFDNYYKDMQRLASAENYYIDRYQSRNQCLTKFLEEHICLKINGRIRNVKIPVRN